MSVKELLKEGKVTAELIEAWEHKEGESFTENIVNDIPQAVEVAKVLMRKLNLTSETINRINIEFFGVALESDPDPFEVEVAAEDSVPAAEFRQALAEAIVELGLTKVVLDKVKASI